MKRNKLMICLVAGVLILAVSVTAAFGSVNGYARYKSALKALAFEETNFSANGVATFSVDGKDLATVEIDAKLAAPDYSYHSKSTANGEVTSETYTTVLNGTETWFQAGSDHYYTYENGHKMTNLFGYDPDDEWESRFVSFMEIAADTVMGDLKNNFVQVGKENGSDLFQVEISQSQVPALINAGLSLMAYSVAEGQSNWNVTYEDYDQTMINYYEQATGTTLPEEFKAGYTDPEGFTDDWWQANEATLDEFYKVIDGAYEKYEGILADKGGGILYVKNDGSYEHYADNKAFMEAHGGDDVFDNLEYYVSGDLVLQNVNCLFGVDKDDHVTSTQLTVTFSSTDAAGGRHSLVIKVDATAGDYGTTTVQPLDVGDRTLAN